MEKQAGEAAKKVLYVKLPQRAPVRKKEICLGDVAELWCSDGKSLNSWKKLPLKQKEPGKQKHFVWSALELREAIYRKDPGMDVRFLGAEDVVVDCRRTPDKESLAARAKLLFVCAVVFVGGAFAIMTFNNDVDVRAIFAELYLRVTGVESNGRTVLEAAYSVGIFLGIVVFFNHIAGWKLTEDPTPLEVEMRKYEKALDDAVVAYEERREQAEEEQS